MVWGRCADHTTVMPDAGADRYLRRIECWGPVYREICIGRIWRGIGRAGDGNEEAAPSSGNRVGARAMAAAAQTFVHGTRMRANSLSAAREPWRQWGLCQVAEPFTPFLCCQCLIAIETTLPASRETACRSCSHMQVVKLDRCQLQLACSRAQRGALSPKLVPCKMAHAGRASR